MAEYGEASGLDIGAWLYNNSGATQLEECHSNWRPAIQRLAADPCRVPTVAESLAAFNQHVRPMERAHRTRHKYVTVARTALPS